MSCAWTNEDRHEVCQRPDDDAGPPKARSVLVHIVEPLQWQDMQGSHNLDHGLAAPAYGGCFGDVGIAGAAHWRRKDVALCMLIFWCRFWAMISPTGRLQHPIFSVALCHSAARKAAQDTQNDGSSVAFRCRRGETTLRGPRGPRAQRHVAKQKFRSTPTAAQVLPKMKQSGTLEVEVKKHLQEPHLLEDWRGRVSFRGCTS